MLRVQINQAKAGMRLATPVRHPNTAVVLLKEGFVLDNMTVNRLADLQINEVWVEYPGTELIRRYISPTLLESRTELLESVIGMFDTVHQDAHAPLEFAHYRSTLQGLIESIVAEPIAASYLSEVGRDGGSDMQHCAEVCFLSLLLGLKLEGYLVDQRKRLKMEHARNVVSLGLGALLHDIGLMRLPAELRAPYDPRDLDPDPRWREHVMLGHKMVTGEIEASAACMVLQHHQHFDGSGFPHSRGDDGLSQGLSGESIHVFARIVCVANHFDRLRHRGEGRVRPRVAVLHEMLCGPLRRRFDPVILAALPQVVPAYAPGSIVRLNTGQQVAVVQWHPESPCQPTVQILGEALDQRFGHRNDPVHHDLRTRNDLWIVEQDGVDVTRYNFVLLLRNQAGEEEANRPLSNTSPPQRRAAG
jgi:response regulator RpfG family c-di-GMP phosphodiesterase